MKRTARCSARLRTTTGKSKVDASAEAIHDIVSNLVVNALESSPQGSQVNINLSWPSLRCVVSVEDEGPGIPVALQEKVLQPFFTTKAQGTGLGLAIVARRVAELGGELKMTSPVREGKGTRFEMTLVPEFLRRDKKEGALIANDIDCR